MLRILPRANQTCLETNHAESGCCRLRMNLGFGETAHLPLPLSHHFALSEK